ncbi:c-type cytochrome domain-containing protein [Anatilimnocola floriformis]|uniref:c-type cytochrome domain-containing protein n=1 Tax=Anatilimnocola floriformis TaxID=2948575 RepID=UPI0020C40222|nr:c-type cytochrome domain-containing protein [Anatilimnocola floriformis]
MSRLSYIAVAIAIACSFSSVRADDAEKIFTSKVRPLLARKCFDCHSAKAEEVKSGLKLDTLADILKGGSTGPAVVPGEPENSFILKALRYEEADYQMPPSGKLSDEDIAIVEEWIKKLKSEK